LYKKVHEKRELGVNLYLGILFDHLTQALISNSTIGHIITIIN